jgi:hypothetical protein
MFLGNPQGLKPTFSAGGYGTTKVGAEKLLAAAGSVPSAAEAASKSKPLIAALKRCATQNQTALVQNQAH